MVKKEGREERGCAIAVEAAEETEGLREMREVWNL
jgi:hypothetical protein